MRLKLTRLLDVDCWKWFNELLKEAGIEVTDENRERIYDVIHKYIGEQSS